VGEYFESRLVVYKYRQLIFTGVAGTMERQVSRERHLSGTVSLIKQRYPNIEIAPIQNQPGRDFLAMFMSDPPRDITIDQGSSVENAIVGYALDQKELNKAIKGLAGAIGFIPHSTPDSQVAQTWRREFELEKIVYDSYIAISQYFQKPLEAVFGMVRYANFLAQYNNIEEEEAIKLAARKFGIPIETFQ